MSPPRIEDIRRWHVLPGDRLILRTAELEITPREAADLRDRLRIALQLPPDLPIVILAKNWDVEVLGDPFEGAAWCTDVRGPGEPRGTDVSA